MRRNFEILESIACSCSWDTLGKLLGLFLEVVTGDIFFLCVVVFIIEITAMKAVVREE